MIDLERYFVEAKIRENAGIANKAKRNEECLNFTKAKADEFIKKFGFLTKYGFVLGLRFRQLPPPKVGGLHPNKTQRGQVPIPIR